MGTMYPRFWRDLTLTTLASSGLIPQHHRWRLYRLFGVDAAPCTVMSGTKVTDRRLHLGEGCFVSTGCFIDASDDVWIGARASLAMGVRIITSSHEIGGPERRAGGGRKAPVWVGDGAWIGAGALILPGASIGAGAVVAAGAVVTKDVPEDTVVAGTPAKQVRVLL